MERTADREAGEPCWDRMVRSNQDALAPEMMESRPLEGGLL